MQNIVCVKYGEFMCVDQKCTSQHALDCSGLKREVHRRGERRSEEGKKSRRVGIYSKEELW